MNVVRLTTLACGMVLGATAAAGAATTPYSGDAGSGALAAASVVIPEPATYGLLGFGVIGLLVARHRDKRSTGS